MLKIFFCHLNALFPLTSWKTTVFEDEPPKAAASGGRNARNRCVLRHQNMGRFGSRNIGASTERLEVEACRLIVDVLLQILHFLQWTFFVLAFVQAKLFLRNMARGAFQVLALEHCYFDGLTRLLLSKILILKKNFWSLTLPGHSPHSLSDTELTVVTSALVVVVQWWWWR